MFRHSRQVSLNECNAWIIVCETQACCAFHCLNTFSRDNSDLTLACGVHVGNAVRSIVLAGLFCRWCIQVLKNLKIFVELRSFYFEEFRRTAVAGFFKRPG